MHGASQYGEDSLAVEKSIRTPQMPVIMIGGSAGALEALQTILGGLPADLGAAIFITTHVPPASPSALPHILTRAGSMFATHGIDGAPIAPNRVIIAPPNHHLFIENEHMREIGRAHV